MAPRTGPDYAGTNRALRQAQNVSLPVDYTVDHYEEHWDSNTLSSSRFQCLDQHIRCTRGVCQGKMVRRFYPSDGTWRMMFIDVGHPHNRCPAAVNELNELLRQLPSIATLVNTRRAGLICREDHWGYMTGRAIQIVRVADDGRAFATKQIVADERQVSANLLKLPLGPVEWFNKKEKAKPITGIKFRGEFIPPPIDDLANDIKKAMHEAFQYVPLARPGFMLPLEGAPSPSEFKVHFFNTSYEPAAPSSEKGVKMQKVKQTKKTREVRAKLTQRALEVKLEVGAMLGRNKLASLVDFNPVEGLDPHQAINAREQWNEFLIALENASKHGAKVSIEVRATLIEPLLEPSLATK